MQPTWDHFVVDMSATIKSSLTETGAFYQVAMYDENIEGSCLQLLGEGAIQFKPTVLVGTISVDLDEIEISLGSSRFPLLSGDCKVACWREVQFR